MVCYKPIKAWRGVVNENGKRPLVFARPKTVGGTALEGQEIPCGQCIGCRLEYSRQWAIRCMHEKQMHEESAFITLTYDNKHLPPLGSLNIEDFQKFMKRLRKKTGKKIRFFQCGEYGDQFQRPHHHALIYGHEFGGIEDVNDNGTIIKASAELAELWPKGFNTVGEITFESAAYVSRYITKKITGRSRHEHYNGRKPEYITMSRRPGIGRLWYDVYKKEVFPCDSVVMRGIEMKPPKYYDKILDKENPQMYNRIKMDRIKKAQEKLPPLEGLKPLDLDSEIAYNFQRLHVREYVQNRRQKDFCKRSLENV